MNTSSSRKMGISRQTIIGFAFGFLIGLMVGFAWIIDKNYKSSTPRPANVPPVGMRSNNSANTAAAASPKVLSYVLYGKGRHAQYQHDMMSIAHDTANSKFFGGWQLWVYHDEYYTEDFFQTAKAINPNIQTFHINTVNTSLSFNVANVNAMGWRFLPLANTSLDIVCPRDIDSPVLSRGEDAVKEWVESGTILHVMRDSIWHNSEIMGGLWCFRISKSPYLAARRVFYLIFNNLQREKMATKGDDQKVLNRLVWPFIPPSDRMHHDSYLCSDYSGSIPFPSKRIGQEFVGCYRPCTWKLKLCPEECRPTDHKDWTYC